MGEEEEMEVEVEEEVELVFDVREVDPDYEFDAPMFFDFTREELLPEAVAAESWFLTAPCYPPSPFVAKLVWIMKNSVDDGSGGPVDRAGPAVSGMEVVDREDGERMHRRILSNLPSNNTQVPSQQLGVASGQAIFNHLPAETKVRLNIEPKSFRSSTLMKPTASMLAKQNRPPSRYPNPLFPQEKIISNSIGVESQAAAKRQKLEGGHMLKVGESKPQTNFLHKAPKKDVNSDKASVPAKLRLTIPREPDLETAHRAQRIRPKSMKESNHAEVAERRYRARPLNRKILDAPLLPLPKRNIPKLPDFQEFHLKTSERALHHPSANSSSVPLPSTFRKDLGKPGNLAAAESGIESKRPNMVGTPRQEGCGRTFAFKARPSNRKEFKFQTDKKAQHNPPVELFSKLCLTSEVQLNNDTRTSFPRSSSLSIKEFRFKTDKKAQHNPPVELFSKLCSTSEPQPNSGTRTPFTRSSSLSIKGSKENRSHLFQTEHKMMGPAKDEAPMYSVKQNSCGSNGCMKEVGNHMNLRNFGIS